MPYRYYLDPKKTVGGIEDLFRLTEEKTCSEEQKSCPFDPSKPIDHQAVVFQRTYVHRDSDCLSHFSVYRTKDGAVHFCSSKLPSKTPTRSMRFSQDGIVVSSSHINAIFLKKMGDYFSKILQADKITHKNFLRFLQNINERLPMPDRIQHHQHLVEEHLKKCSTIKAKL